MPPRRHTKNYTQEQSINLTTKNAGDTKTPRTMISMFRKSKTCPRHPCLLPRPSRHRCHRPRWPRTLPNIRTTNRSRSDRLGWNTRRQGCPRGSPHRSRPLSTIGTTKSNVNGVRGHFSSIFCPNDHTENTHELFLCSRLPLHRFHLDEVPSNVCKSEPCKAKEMDFSWDC